MNKAQIRELFFRDRTVRLRLPWTDRFDILIPERALRLIITGLVGFFLLMMALALVSQLRDNRQQHQLRENDITLLHADNTARALRLRLIDKQYAGQTLPPLNQVLLDEVLSTPALEGERNYLIVGADGMIAASRPDASFVGQTIGSVMEAGFVTSVDVNSHALSTARRATGNEVVTATRNLGYFPGSLIVFQKRGDELATWWDSVKKLALLFASTLFILTLLTGALHWQFGKAEDADRMLGIATDRLDKALIGGECGLWDWNLTNGSIFWSLSMFGALGMAPTSQFLTLSDVAKRIHPDDPRLDDFIEELLNGQRDVFDQEFRMRHEEGHYVWLRARAALSKSPDTGVMHLVGIVFDISRQKEQDELNRRAEVRLKDAIENISEAFVLWDTESKLVLCNTKYQQFHSLPSALCQPGTHYNKVAQASREPLVQQLVSEQVQDASGARTMEVQLADGRWLQINERRTKDGGFVSVGTDISMLKRQADKLQTNEKNLMRAVTELEQRRVDAEQTSQRLAELADNYLKEKARAETANRAKSEFLANMSHELRTPLNAILGFSEIMSSEMLGPLGTPKYGEYAMDIHRSGQFLLDVINDVLDMSKIEAGRTELELEDVTLQHVIDDVLRIIGPRANEGGITLKSSIKVAETFVADRRALKQIMINVLANAVKFTPEGGQVHINARQTRHDVIIDIKDTGIGIPPDDLNKIGRPFEQVENQFTKSRGGSGLGLAISKSLIALHHGKLEIESKVDHGTTVRVVIPRQVFATRPRLKAA